MAGPKARGDNSPIDPKLIAEPAERRRLADVTDGSAELAAAHARHAAGQS